MCVCVCLRVGGCARGVFPYEHPAVNTAATVYKSRKKNIIEL